MDCCVQVLIIWIWWLCHEPWGRGCSCSPSCDWCPLRKVAWPVSLVLIFSPLFNTMAGSALHHLLFYARSINRGCNKNLMSHHTTDDHLHMKNNALACQEGKVGGIVGKEHVWWCDFPINQSTSSGLSLFTAMTALHRRCDTSLPSACPPSSVSSSCPAVWCWAVQ